MKSNCNLHVLHNNIARGRYLAGWIFNINPGSLSTIHDKFVGQESNVRKYERHIPGFETQGSEVR
jgi:hypothetical protein